MNNDLQNESAQKSAFSSLLPSPTPYSLEHAALPEPFAVLNASDLL